MSQPFSDFQQQNPAVYQGGFAGYAVDRQRVLRNTYWLLALSMIPTVLGAWMGVSLGFAQALSPGLSTIVFLVGAIGFMIAIEKTKESTTGVYVLLGFTFFMGLMLSRMIGWALGFRNGASLVMTAGGGTAAIFFVMASVASVVKRELGGLAKFLTIGVVLLLVASLINLFVQSSAAFLAMSVIAIGIFSAFIVVDLKRVIDGGETNYISATLAIYLDLYNIFQNLLALLGIFGGERD